MKALINVTAAIRILFCLIWALGGSNCDVNASPIIGGSSWKQNFNNPTTVGVKVQGAFNVLGEGRISLAGVSASVTNYGDVSGETWLYSQTVEAKVIPYQIYSVVLSGDSVYALSLANISVSDNAPIIGNDPGNVQKRYRIYVYNTNAVNYVYNKLTHYYESQSVTNWTPLCSSCYPNWNCESDGDGDCAGPASTHCIIQVRPENRYVNTGSLDGDDANPWDEDSVTDAAVAPGDGTPVTLAAGESLEPAELNFSWSVSLGRLWNGSSAGEIRLLGQQLGATAFTPALLNYTARSCDTNEVDVRKGGYLQQIKTPQALVNVSILASNIYQLEFYLSKDINGWNTNGVGTYALNPQAAPYVIWRVDSQDGSLGRWRLQEIRNGATKVAILEYGTSGQVWKLSQGSDADSRVETRAITIGNQIVNVTTNWFRTEFQEIKNGVNVVSDRCSETYRKFDWGFELVAVTNDPGGENLATEFQYGTDPSSPEFGKLISTTYPDGFWEKRLYSAEDEWGNECPAWLYRIVQPWKDSPIESAIDDCLVTEYSQNTADCEIKKWHGMSKYEQQGWDEYNAFYRATIYSEYNFFDQDDCGVNETYSRIKLTGIGARTGGPRAQIDTTTYYGASIGRLAGQVEKKFDNASLLDVYDYQFGTWNYNVCQFDPESNIDHDVRQVIYHGAKFGLVSGYDFNPDDPGSLNSEQVIYVGDSGNSLGASGVPMLPFKNTKDVKIISNGNLVAKEEYVYIGGTNFALIEQTIYERDCLGHATNVYHIDPATHDRRVIYQADWKGGQVWPEDVKLSESDTSGIKTVYLYDALKRTKAKVHQGGSISGYPAQGDITNTLCFDAAGRVLTNIITASGLSQKTINLYDKVGRMVRNTTPDQLTTMFNYLNGGREIDQTFSSGATKILKNYLDRRIVSITGSAVTNQFFDYQIIDAFGNDPIANFAGGFLGDGGLTGSSFVPRIYESVRLGAENSLRQTANIYDKRNILVGKRMPAFNSANNLYQMNISMCKQVSNRLQSGVEDEAGNQSVIFTDYSYDATGLVNGELVSAENGYFPFLWGKDRAIGNSRYYEQNEAGHWFFVTRQYVLLENYSEIATLQQTEKERVTGFSSHELDENLNYDINSNLTDVKTVVDRDFKKLTKTTTTSESSLSATNITFNGLVQTETTLTVAVPTWHYYDSLGRQISQKSPLGFLDSVTYDPLTGQITTQTDATGLVTAYDYYPAGQPNAGLLRCKTGPTGRKTWYQYNDRGQLAFTWGDVPYPQKLEYNIFGDLTTMTTYRSGSGWTGSSWPFSSTGTGDVTQWFYDEATGLLTNKTDAKGWFVTYTYYNNWLPRTRSWGRTVLVTNSSTSAVSTEFVTETNRYDFKGDLLAQEYNDGTPNVYINDYNRAGQPQEIVDGSGICKLTFDKSGYLVSSFYSASEQRYIAGEMRWVYCPLAGLTVSNHFDEFYRRDSIRVLNNSAKVLEDTYTYDNCGRLATVGSGTCWASYGYAPNSDLLQTTTDYNNDNPNGARILTTTRTWDYGMRLRSISNVVGDTPVTSHAYQYDALNRRTQATLEDGSFWQYSYNDRDELTSASRKWSYFTTATPVAGQQFGYNYDNIGNRNWAKFGGDTNSSNLQTISYVANSLNQYTGITTPGSMEIIGAALATNNVTVNGGVADRHGEYFHREISVANTNQPVWQNVTNIAGTFTNKGGSLLPANGQALAYDADGNLRFDGIWTYQWDGENRLVAMWMTNGIANLATTNRLRLDFAYDHLGRRVQKIVSIWNVATNDFVSATTNRFVYDGWNLLAVVNPQSSVLQSFTWGQDVSGTMADAGGIGGLLMARFSGTNCFACYGGNGNLTALINASDKSIAARYEYSPYGELLRATGKFAQQNPFRFSTKFWDDESNLIYFGLRYYNSVVGKWINKDLIGETGGYNLYTFLGNKANGVIDPLGNLMLLDVLITNSGEDTGEVVMVQRGVSLTSRIRRAIKSMDQLQQFSAGYQESQGLDVSDMLLSIQAAQSALSQNLRGWKSGAKAAALVDDMHHVFPQAGSLAKFFSNNNINPQGALSQINGFLHRFGMHGGGGGGAYNDVWNEFASKNKAMKNNPYYVIGFGFGLLERITPYLKL